MIEISMLKPSELDQHSFSEMGKLKLGYECITKEYNKMLYIIKANM